MRLERGTIVNVLVLVLALGSGAALLLTRERATTAEREARANNLFVEFPRQRLEHITIRKGTSSLTLSRASGGDASAQHFVMGGVTLDADAVESLLRSLEMAAFFKRFQPEAAERERFGLNQPSAEITLEFGDSRAVLRVGKPATSPRDTTYVEVEANGRREVGLVRSNVLAELVVDEDALRARALVKLEPSEVAALSFRDDELAVELHRGPGPAWLDARGERVRRETVEHVLLELASVKIERFVPAPPTDAGSPRGRLSVRLTPKSTAGAASAPISFTLGGSCPQDPQRLLVERGGASPVTGCVASGVRELFQSAAQELADDSAFALRSDEVESLVLERGHDKLELVRNERGFLLLSPARADVALDAGNRRLDAILKAAGERLPSADPAALGLAPPARTVTARSTAFEGQRYDEVVELGRVDASGRLPVRRREDGRVLLLSRDAARAYAVDSTLLRGTKLLDFSQSQLKRLELEWDHEHEVLRRGDSGELELVTPAHMTHDGALALDLIQALGTLSALRWVADSDDGSFGLEAPQVTARLELADGAAPAKSVLLRVGARVPGGAYATLNSQPGVFIIERGVVELLTTLLFTRGAFMSDPETLARIELEHQGTRVTLTRQDQRFQARPELPEALVTELVEDIASLRAEGAVHSGPARAEEGLQRPTLSVRLFPKTGQQPRTFHIGARDSYRDAAIYYGRVDGIDATFALPLSSVKKLLEAL